MNKPNSFDVAYQYQSETDVLWLQVYITGKIMTINLRSESDLLMQFQMFSPCVLQCLNMFVILFTHNKPNSLLYLLTDWRRNVAPTICLRKRKSKRCHIFLIFLPYRKINKMRLQFKLRDYSE
jgi:hypothetical protein